MASAERETQCPLCNGAGEFESALHCEKCHACNGTGKMTDRAAAPASERPDLHAAIMNLPFTLPASGVVSQDYLKGHEDARHAAADLIRAALASPAGTAQPTSADVATPTQDDRVRYDNALRQIWAAFDDWSEQEKGLARTVWWHAERAALAAPVGTTTGRETSTVADHTDSSRVDWLHGWADLRLETWFEAGKGIEHRINRNGRLIGAGRTLRDAIDAARSPASTSGRDSASATSPPTPAAEAVVQDAERYRFLKEQVKSHSPYMEGTMGYRWTLMLRGNGLDDAIDRLRNTQGERNGD